MADLNSALGSLATSTPDRPETQSDKRRHLLAALLSALVPGVGQFFLKEKRTAAFLVAALSCLCLGYWPLRAPRAFNSFASLAVFWFALYVYAAGNALLARARSTTIRPSKWWLLLFIPLTIVSCHLIGAALIRASGFRAFTVPSKSMESTILPGDRIVVDTRYYHKHSPQRGDVLVFHKDDLYVIKRIIAIGGDTIEGKNQQILISGTILKEPYVQHTQSHGNAPKLDDFDPVLVPDGSYFVIGDNRDISLDSRYPGYGLVASKSIVGKALYTISAHFKSDRISVNLESRAPLSNVLFARHIPFSPFLLY
jgi:signal peptidase I